MPRLPDVLTDELTPAEFSALRLDRDAFALGNGYLTADALDLPTTRIRIAFGGHSSRLIAALSTASWVWGARDLPPATHEFCVSFDERARLAPGARDAVREVAITTDEFRLVGGRRVTSPARTALDLARFRDDEHHDIAELARLLALVGDAEPHPLCTLDERRHLTHAVRARARLTAARSAAAS